MNYLGEKMEKERIGKETVLVSPSGAGMKWNLRSLWVALFVVAAMALFSACAPTGDDAEPTTPPDDTTVAPTPDPEPEPVVPSDLEVVQKRASDAAAAAMTAANAAKEAADAAALAGDMLASIQTGDADYKMYRDAAKKAYEDAMTAYNEAKKQSDAAQAATRLVDAVTAAVNAGYAQGDAETAQQAAETARDKAMVEGLLMIDGNDISAGDSMLNTNDAKKSETSGGKTVITGLLDKDEWPIRVIGPTTAVEGVSKTATLAYKAPKAFALARTFEIGKTLDSSDDMARLMLVTKYAGTRTVKIFTDANAGNAADLISGTKPDRVSVAVADGARIAPNAVTDATRDNFALTRVGTYYRATDGATGTANRPDHTDSIPDVDASNDQTGKPLTVYKYSGDGGSPDDATDDFTFYVVLQGTNKTPSGTTYSYQLVNIHTSGIDRDGDGATDDDNNIEVRAELPDVADYKHIHFGVWAGLKTAADSGAQDIVDLGTGFVQNHDGSGMTPIGGTSDDMPNSGEGTYEGDWVAAVRAADNDGDGDITLQHGAATLVAEFGKAKVTATLMGLATLEGAIDGNVFSGDKDASGVGSGKGGLDVAGKFTGTLRGRVLRTRCGRSWRCLRLHVDGHEGRRVPRCLWRCEEG